MANQGNKKYYISGTVIDRKTRRGVKGLRVEAWDKDRVYNDLVGSAFTDEQGVFQIEFDESYFRELFQDRQPDLFFRVFREGALIRSTEDSVLWNVRAGETKITLDVDIPSGEEPPPPSDLSRQSFIAPLSITGFIINTNNGYPLAGLHVLAYFDELASEDDREDYESQSRQEHLLGGGTSDSSGRFEIAYRDTRSVRQKLCLLTQCEGSSFVLRVENADGKTYYVSKPLSGSSGSVSVTLSVPLPVHPVSLETWQNLGERLEQTRLIQIHDLVRQLGLVSPAQSLFDGWDLETR